MWVKSHLIFSLHFLVFEHLFPSSSSSPFSLDLLLSPRITITWITSWTFLSASDSLRLLWWTFICEQISMQWIFTRFLLPNNERQTNESKEMMIILIFIPHTLPSPTVWKSYCNIPYSLVVQSLFHGENNRTTDSIFMTQGWEMKWLLSGSGVR